MATQGQVFGAPQVGGATPLAATHVFVGNASGLATDVAMSGNVTLSNSGAATVGGVLAATSIALGGGSALADYVSAGSWTPTDASGASLTFTGVSANYTRIGNMVFAYGTVTYPVTGDASAASIGGLPLGTANAQYARQCLLTTTSETTLRGLVPGANSTTFSLATSTGAGITNAVMSSDYLYFMAIYPVA